MWATILKIAVRLALYAAGHPDKVKAVLSDVARAKGWLEKAGQ